MCRVISTTNLFGAIKNFLDTEERLSGMGVMDTGVTEAELEREEQEQALRELEAKGPVVQQGGLWS